MTPLHSKTLTFRTVQPIAVKGLIVTLLLVFQVNKTSGAPQNHTESESGLSPIRSYISSGWDSLTRSLSDCGTVLDPKLAEASVLYLPAELKAPPLVSDLAKRCKIQVKNLPAVIHRVGEIDSGKIDPPGLLYLENKYVVPGGRFNEMYGWDSYFIILGLLRSGRTDLARGMVENFFFEIEHYGAVLNANRTYYLTRSQPPFLSSMIFAVYDAEKSSGRENKTWLAIAYQHAVKDYSLWATEPHLDVPTGLSRYYDFGEGPAAESLQDETGHYRKVATFFLSTPDLASRYLVQDKKDSSTRALVGKPYIVQVCDSGTTTAKPECETANRISLSGDYYKGDRAMRESGFDISFRFGPYGAASHHYAPVCLNSLLYKTEKDLERMSQLLGKDAESQQWRKRAENRKEKITRYLWSTERGLFFDYNTETHTQSNYEYITTFYPLWAGLATQEQSQAVLSHTGKFERPGGLMMSPYETGVQWDAPYAWAPTQLLAVEGMRRYGFKDDADRVSYNFAAMVADNFRRDGTIREKYNAVTRSSEVAVTAGYSANVIGFGWTNGVFLEFLHELPRTLVDRLAIEQKTAAQTIH